MYRAPQHHDLHSVDETRLIGRILLLVIYLFVGSLLSLTAVTSLFASDSLDVDSATYDQEPDSRIGYTGKITIHHPPGDLDLFD